MALEKLLTYNTQVVAVVDQQWGDTGKGKVVDMFAEWADVVARGTGGSNAGHTLVFDDKEIILHLLNVGAVYDKITILGNGMVINLPALVEEIGGLAEYGINCDKLRISRDAHVVMPYHIGRDQANNQSLKNGGIGSTGRGIGPCYADKIARKGIMIRDLYDRDILHKKIRKGMFLDAATENGLKYVLEGTQLLVRSPSQITREVEDMMAQLEPLAQRIKPYVTDTVKELHAHLREGKKILLEGAQGLLLSIEFGTYPYVTSSDPSLNGTAAGVGLSARDVDLALGVVKFPFMTRVGGGPFPTELAGKAGEEYCQEENRAKENELSRYNIKFTKEGDKIKYDFRDQKILELVNSEDELTQAIGIRLAAGEFGASTGRPRRIGWTDAMAARYAQMINGRDVKLILTKADCLAGIEEFKLCCGYAHPSSGMWIEFSRDSNFLRKVEPEYTKFHGYGDLSEVQKFKDLPGSLQSAINLFERYAQGKVVAVSNGPKKEQVIFRR